MARRLDSDPVWMWCAGRSSLNTTMRPNGKGFLLLLATLLGNTTAFLAPAPALERAHRTLSRHQGGLYMSWLDTKARIEVPASAQEAYGLYSDLEAHPTWSPWLRRVSMDRATRESEWELQSKGIKVTWKAKNTIEEPPYKISWESITGLPNRGLVTFVESGGGMTVVELTISYSLPKVVAKLFAKASFAQRFIENTLLEDLTRFKMVLLKQLREERMKKQPPM